MPFIRLNSGRVKPPSGSRVNYGHDLAKGLIGAWLLNEGAGTRIYDSAFDSHGTFTSNAMTKLYWVPGPSGRKCLKFDPDASTTGEAVNIGDGSNTPAKLTYNGSGSVTIFAHVKPIQPQQSNWGYVYACNDGATGAEYGIVISTVPYFNHRIDSSSRTNTNLTLVTNTWYNLSYTYDDGLRNQSGSDSNFINGTYELEAKTNATVDAGSGVCIGRNPGVSNRFFQGEVDFIYHWNRPLTFEEHVRLNEDPFQFYHTPVIYWTEPTVAGGAMEGSASIAFTGDGILSGTGNMQGASAPAFTGDGILSGTGALEGVSAPTFSASGTLSGTGAMQGASTVAFTNTGTLAGVGSLQGEVAVSFANSGTLSGIGNVAGASNPVFSLTGELHDASVSRQRIRVTF